jgi:HSP20 family protein
MERRTTMATAPTKQKADEKVALTPRRPFEALSHLERDMERMFEEIWRRPFTSLFDSRRWWPARVPTVELPALDVYEEKDIVVIKAELPGLLKEEIDLNITGSTLTLRGEKKKEEEVKEEDYYCRERYYGSMTRTVELPTEVKADQVKATFKDGVLEVRLPKTEEAKQKTIKVKID